MSSGLYQIDKLDSENYDGWKIQMRSVLIHCDLWGYVSGTHVVPTDGNALTTYTSKDQKALATIVLSVKASQLLHVSKCKTSEEAWKALEEVHCPRGPARKVTIFKQLLALKMIEGKTMEKHLSDFADLSEKLLQIDIKIEDELLAIILLSSLPIEYENFVVAIESRDDLPNTSALKTKLLEEAKRRENVLPANENKERAFFQKNKNKQKENKDSSKEPNHSNSRNKYMSRKCYRCNRKGHYASSCRSQIDPKNANNSSAASFAMLNVIDTDIELSKSDWVFDSGSTCHMCCDKSKFCSTKPHKEKIELAGEKYLNSESIGEIILETENMKVTLRDVLYVPQLKTNFLSIGKVTSNNYNIKFNGVNAIIRNQKGTEILRAPKAGYLYVYNEKYEHSNTEKLCAARLTNENFLVWHRRYGHLNAASLSSLHKNNMVLGLNLKGKEDVVDCKTCFRGKMTVLPFPNTTVRSKEKLELIHSDICGPMKNKSLGHYSYFVLFIDDFSRKMFVYFLKNKSDVFEAFKEFKMKVELETGKRIKILRTDNGGEYLSSNFSNFLKSAGIKRQLTAPYTPQQNGVAERANRTVVEMARCMLLDASLPEFLWGEAVNTAVYLRNRSPTKALKNQTPLQAWSNIKPNVSHLRMFGCKAIMLEKRPYSGKFGAKGFQCVLVGYSSESKAYRLYDSTARKI